MGKLTKYTLKMVLASILVWSITVVIFTDEIVFTQSEQTETGDAVNVDEVADGIYMGAAEGFGGPIEVEVTVEDGEITEINVLSHNETEGASDPAFENVPVAIIDNNSTDVDIASGATVSSTGIMEAVNNALTGSNATEDDLDEPSEVEEELEEEPVAAINVSEVADGTYTAVVDGHNDDLEVEVVVEGGTIVDVVVIDHAETDGLADPAIEDVPAAIIENNSTEVDTVSGATVTSEAIIEAVNTALENAE